MEQQSEIAGYPLQWPMGWGRTDYPGQSRFHTSFGVARDSLLREVELLGGTNVIISSNIRLRRDGYPYTNTGRPSDQGVCVYFALNGESQAVPCDKWILIEDNMQAINRTVEALRGLERWGAKEMVNAAFRGFKALPMATRYFDGCTTKEETQSRFRKLAKEMHPDKGGDMQSYVEMQEEYTERLLNI